MPGTTDTHCTPTHVPFRMLALVLALAALVAVPAGLGLARVEAGTIGTGVVVVDTTLGYQGGEAAGTGMVLTPGGKILTNNHVIEGATAVRVVVPGTGRRYAARVLGYSVSNDVAVLQLRNAANLTTISPASGSKLRLGQTVSATGNARGTGTLSTVSGRREGPRSAAARRSPMAARSAASHARPAFT